MLHKRLAFCNENVDLLMDARIRQGHRDGGIFIDRSDGRGYIGVRVPLRSVGAG